VRGIGQACCEGLCLCAHCHQKCPWYPTHSPSSEEVRAGRWRRNTCLECAWLVIAVTRAMQRRPVHTGGVNGLPKRAHTRTQLNNQKGVRRRRTLEPAPECLHAHRHSHYATRRWYTLAKASHTYTISIEILSMNTRAHAHSVRMQHVKSGAKARTACIRCHGSAWHHFRASLKAVSPNHCPQTSYSVTIHTANSTKYNYTLTHRQLN
jgi:hypothetical protein